LPSAGRYLESVGFDANHAGDRDGDTFMSLGSKPVYVDGKWSFEDQSDLYLEKSGVEQFKTSFYKLEGWSVDKGWPTRKTLDELGMKKIADTMAAKGKIGA
jgi:hypothetical protein